MKKLLLFAAAALCLVGCENNEPKRGSNNLNGRVYFCSTQGQQYDIEYYLLFSTQTVVDSSALKWHVEPSGIDAPDPTVWSYKLDGELLTLHNDNPYTGDYYATYRDSVIYKGSLIYRKQ